ncbi:MAG: methyltransferase, partial [Bacteroidales bacterium]|nr:methyltransferase [Bacteroidales bacterium]
MAFNESIRRDPLVEQVILPVRDGIMLIRKI